jgi:hypothetical protein
MTFKLATAAAMVLASATASNAADLAKKAPAAVDYVKVCDTYGAGFFYIPGSDTCLKIGGYARFQLRGGDESYGATDAAYYGNFGQARSANSINTTARFQLEVDARSMTEFGLLRAFGALQFNNGSAAPDKAYIQWGGLSAGYKTSNWDFFTGEALGGVYGDEQHDDTVNLLAYTFGLGNGVTATLSVEDPSFAGRVNSGTSTQVGIYALWAGSYGGVKAPDVVANINVTQAWGSAQVMAVAHEAYGSTSTNDGGWGFAVGAGAKINLPMLGAGDELGIQAAYADGALAYLTDNLGKSANSTEVWDFGFNGDTSTGWSALVGLKHVFAPTVSAAADFGYASVDLGGSDFKFDQYTIRGSVTWTPVKNLAISGGVDYRNTNGNSAYNNAGFVDGDGWAATLRVQRSF